jgi:hypothetical protein
MRAKERGKQTKWGQQKRKRKSEQKQKRIKEKTKKHYIR